MARPSRWDDVVAAAARAFRTRGFAKASLEEIAEDLGMWKGSLYNYISSKEDLLTAVVEIPAERLLDAARELRSSDRSVEEKLHGIVRCHVDVLIDTFDFAAVYLHEVAARDLGDRWHAIDQEYWGCVEAIVIEGIELGELDPTIDPMLATMTLLGALNWLTRWWDPQRGPLNPDVVVDQIARSTLRGWAAPQGAAGVSPAPPSKPRRRR